MEKEESPIFLTIQFLQNLCPQLSYPAGSSIRHAFLVDEGFIKLLTRTLLEEMPLFSLHTLSNSGVISAELLDRNSAEIDEIEQLYSSATGIIKLNMCISNSALALMRKEVASSSLNRALQRPERAMELFEWVVNKHFLMEVLDNVTTTSPSSSFSSFSSSPSLSPLPLPASSSYLPLYATLLMVYACYADSNSTHVLSSKFPHLATEYSHRLSAVLNTLAFSRPNNPM